MTAPDEPRQPEEAPELDGVNEVDGVGGDGDTEAPPAPGDEPRRVPLVPGIRLVRLFWRMLGPLAICANVAAWPRLLGASEDLQQQALVVAGFLAGYALLLNLARELLSPRNAELRLLPIADHRAERLFATLRAVLVIVLGTHLAIYLVHANGWNESVASVLGLLEKVGLIFFGYAALRRSGLIEKFTPEKGDSYLGLTMRLLFRVVLPLAFLTLIFYVAATALGYGALSRWVVMNAAWSCAYLVLLGLGFRFLRTRLHKTVNFMRDERSAETEAEGGGSTAPWYIGVERILIGALQILFLVLLFFGLTALWGIETQDVDAVLAKPALIGGGTWGDLLAGLAKAVFAWIAYGFVRNVLIFMVFPKAGVESGARYAMLTVLKYVAVIFVVILVLTALGADTSTLAVFAGGASVGLGFAMKDVFSNFFGGLIMLLERPVRVGDTIEVDGIKGKVEAIRLRGTVLRTFDGTIVIIPNTSMISTNLANLTYGLETARMQIDVGVAYHEDPEKVERILREIAHADPRVLDDPEPAVRFVNFGASSLDFSLRVWTRVLDQRWAMVSEMRHRIFERFQEENIEIPFAQMDLHLRSDDTKPAPRPTPETPETKEQTREAEQTAR